jgi:hypothetical protein
MQCPWSMRLTFPLLGALHFVVSAAEVLPVHLIGTWGTAESLYEGTDKQTEVHLLTDGYGIVVGSTQALQRVGGLSDGQPGPRAIVGFPVEAVLNGDVLMLRVLWPAKAPVQESGGPALACRYDRAGPTLACTGPDGVPMMLKRRSEVVSAATTQTIRAFQIDAR